MMNSFKENKSGSFIMSVVVGVVIGFAVMLVLTLLGAFLMSAAGLSTASANVISVIILGISAFICGLVAAKKASSRALLTGAAAGAFMYLLVAVISAAVTRSGFSGTFVLRMIISVVAAAIGALIAVLRSGNKKYI